jgi:DNA-directed RNA polymerase specialized sigma24 family protein
MINAKKLASPEVREKVTFSILHLLAILPEAHKKIFIWKHYHGWPETQIASRLGWSTSDVERTLNEIRRTLFQRTEAILLNERAHLEEADHRAESYATCCA